VAAPDALQFNHHEEKPITMTLFSRTRIVTLITFVACLAGAPGALHAQATKIFVASYGNDANDGSRGSPKRTFQLAHDAVASAGQIVVLDTAGYGPLTITKSLAITVPPGVSGFVTVLGSGNGIVLNAGSTGVVALRGLIIEGGGSSANGNGIYVINVGHLSIEDCTVRNFEEGIFFIPSTNAKLYVYNTTVRSCGFGIDVETAGAATTLATVSGCRMEQNSTAGLEAYTPQGSGTVDVSLADSIISGGGTGINADGAGTVPALVRVSTSSITGNTIGVKATGNGQVISRVNNTLEKNGSGNVFIGSAYNAK
jgi:hypothetical protein